MCRPFWLLATVVVIVSALTTALPTGPALTATAEEETVATDFLVDAPQFAHLLSTHLLFDHLENAFHLLSKQISSRFRESIQVNVRLQSPAQYEDTAYSSVDVQILKGQLNGAVGSFIEDKLPTVWSRYTAALDKSALQAYIENVLGRLCSTSGNDDNVYDETGAAASSGFISSQCLEQHAGQFLSLVDRYVGNHVKRTMLDITSHELPSLFDMTRSQVEQILSHFNTHVLSDGRLKLVLATDHDGLAADSTTEMNQILETAAHWEMPSEENDDNRGDNNALYSNNNPSSSSRFTRETVVQAVQHFANLARHSTN